MRYFERIFARLQRTLICVEFYAVFNFTTQEHDVAKVTKAAFDSCDSTSSISLQTNGPASIALNQSGEHFFICTIGQHCSLGQKLGINVSTASAPAPAPTTSPPPPPSASAPAPATTPTRSPMTYTVGDDVGWNVLPNTTQGYELWAANKTFVVGDILGESIPILISIREHYILNHQFLFNGSI